MKYQKQLLCLLAVWVFALSGQARMLTEEVFQGDAKLRATAQTLQLAEDDWPETEDQVLHHCLTELRKRDAKKPSMNRHQRVQFLDDCAVRWTTVGELKSQYTD